MQEATTAPRHPSNICGVAIDAAKIAIALRTAGLQHSRSTQWPRKLCKLLIIKLVAADL